MGYTAMTPQGRAGKRRWKGAENPCRENGKTLIPQLPEIHVVKLTTWISVTPMKGWYAYGKIHSPQSAVAGLV